MVGLIYGVHHPSTWAVVVPSFNHADDAITCLAALWNAEPRPGMALLVDDASTDDAVAQIAGWAEGIGIDHEIVPARSLQSKVSRSWLTIAAAETNAGFVRSCNIGLGYVRDFTEAPFVLLLNNDTEIAPNYFAELAKALDRAPESPGLLSGSIYEWDRSTVWYGGASFNPIRALATHKTDLPDTDAPTATGYVCGCSMLISRPVLEKVGLLAESFQPAYVEDVDYSLRARAAGFPVMIARSAVCYHRVGTSLGRLTQSPRTVFSVNRNRAFTLRRNYTGWRRAAGIAYLAVTKPGRALLELGKGRPRTAWAVLTGMLTGVFGQASSQD